MNPLQAWKLYRRSKRVADLLKEASVDKSLFKSKTFWFNVLTSAAEVAQSLGDTRIIPTEYMVLASAVINIGLRIVTAKPVTLPGSGGSIPTAGKKMALVFAFLGMGIGLALAQGQPATSKDYFAWDIEGPSLATVQGYTYTLELDGVTLSGPAGTLCAAGPTSSSFTCKTPVVAMTPGQHVLRVKATETVDGVPLDSEWSEAFEFTMRAAPATPGKPRIVRAP